MKKLLLVLLLVPLVSFGQFQQYSSQFQDSLRVKEIQDSIEREKLLEMLQSGEYSERLQQIKENIGKPETSFINTGAGNWIEYFVGSIIILMLFFLWRIGTAGIRKVFLPIFSKVFGNQFADDY